MVRNGHRCILTQHSHASDGRILCCCHVDLVAQAHMRLHDRRWLSLCISEYPPVTYNVGVQ